MKHIFPIRYSVLRILAIFFASIVLSSCTKVINIDLNSASPQTVIVGNVSDQPGPCVVTLSQTVNFSQPNVFPPITGALVTISDNVGNTATLQESPPGTYTTSAIQGMPGRTYTMNVIANGKTYTSASTMPSPVNIDTIVYTKSRFGNRYSSSAKFLDPSGGSHYYALFFEINNVIQPNFSSTDDNLRNGDTISMRIPVSDNTTLKSGDSVIVTLESIDQYVREYFRLLLELNNSNGITTASPANPVSNISNNALGYFSAHSDTKKRFIVP